MREIFTDMLFKCGNHNATKQLSKYNNNVYLYHFDHVSSFNKYLSNKVECFNHTCHEFEMYYVFEPNMATMIDKKNNEYANATWTNSELMLSENIQRFCGNFAITHVAMQPMWNGLHIIKKKVQRLLLLLIQNLIGESLQIMITIIVNSGIV